jgi:RNA-directed DNA polymerase
METWSTHQLYQQAAGTLGLDTAAALQRYAQDLMSNGFPVVFTLGHLSKITGVSYQVLRQTVNRKRESANYRMYAVKKRRGGRRFIHSVSKDLFRVQQFINQEILQKCIPHSSSFAFHPTGGIKQCATMHIGARWLFQFDLS